MSHKKFLFLMSSFLISFIALAIGPVFAAETGDPAGNLRELGVIIAQLINFLMGIVGAIAIIMIVVGGIRYILAGGDMKATQSAKGTITFAVVGLVIVLLSVVIVNFIGNILGAGNLNFIQIGI